MKAKKKMTGKKATKKVTKKVPSKKARGKRAKVTISKKKRVGKRTAQSSRSSEVGPIVSNNGDSIEVSASTRMTVNMGNYESVQVSAFVTVPMGLDINAETEENIQAKLEEVYNIANGFIASKVEAIREKL